MGQMSVTSQQFFQAHKHFSSGLIFPAYLTSAFFFLWDLYLRTMAKERTGIKSTKMLHCYQFLGKMFSFYLPTFPHCLSFLKLNTLVCGLGKHLPPTKTCNQKHGTVLGFLRVLVQPSWKVRLPRRGLNFLRCDWDKEWEVVMPWWKAILKSVIKLLLLGVTKYISIKYISIISSFRDL